VIFDIVEYIIMESTMPNESRICGRVLIPKKIRKVLLASLQSSIGKKSDSKTKQGRFGVDKYFEYWVLVADVKE